MNLLEGYCCGENPLHNHTRYNSILMNLGLHGKVAVVLAASKGLGKAAALTLAKEGAHVVIGAREETTLQATAREIQAVSEATVLAVPHDVTKPQDGHQLVTRAIAEFGHINILVNNAGGPPAGTFDSFGEADWQQAFELNLLSAVRMIQLVLPYMKKSGGGRIINMVSIAAKQPVDTLILSNSIRAGVIGMAKTLATEIAADGITVNNILTGLFLTDRIRKLHHLEEKLAQGMREEDILNEVVRDIPMKRLGTTEEYGALVAFLASEQAAYITGTSIQIDGGLIRSLL